MGYLVCEKCQGYYKLKKGEAIDNFEGCQCGGNFKYVGNFDELKSFIDNQSEIDDKSICPNCGNENQEDEKFCTSCGKPLNIKHISEKPKKKISVTKNPKTDEISEKNGINLMAIVFGTIAAIVIYFIYFLNIFIIPALFSGLVAGYFTSKGNYLKSILYGAFTSLIGISIGYVITNIIYNSIFSIESTYISIQPLQFIEIVLLAIVLGAIGGLFGSYLRKKSISK